MALRYYARLSDLLGGKDIRVVITGSGEEEAIASDIIKLTHSKIINAAGRTNVTQLAALIKRCRVYITGDSAPMHLASSMGTDFIALFGPTDHKRHYEATDKGTVLQKKVNCGPCYKATCKKIVCMEKIGVDEVYKLVMERIN